MTKNLIRIEADKDVVEINYSPTRMAFNNFISGIAWGVGSVLGATIIVALVIFFFSKLDAVPFIGDFISRIISEVENQQVR